MSKLNQPGKSYCLLPGDEIDLDHWSLRVSGQPNKGLSKLRGQAGLSLELRFCKQFRPDKAGCGHSRDQSSRSDGSACEECRLRRHIP